MELLTLQLPDILQPHEPLLNTIAESWFAYGATNVAIWGDGHIYANWTTGKQDITESQPTHTQISASIKVNDHTIAQLHIFGPNNRLKRKRLKLDAQIIAQNIRNQMMDDEQKTLNRRIGVLQSQLEEQNVEMTHLEAELDIVEKRFNTFQRLSQLHLDQFDLPQYLYALREVTATLISVETVFTFVDSLSTPQLLDGYPRPLGSPAKVLKYIMDQAAEDEIINNYPNIRDLPTSVRNLVAIPIIANEHIRVRLGLVNKLNGEFTNGDIDILRLFTKQVTRHVEQLQQDTSSSEQSGLEEEMVMAFNVQHDLFPHDPPEIPGLDLYAYSRSAKHVGGDFYDYLTRYDGQLAFSIGDVSGKGMSSALMMGITRTLLKSKSNRGDLPTPQAILAETVADLYEDFMRVQMFATVFTGFFNPITMELVYANAGHGPVIYSPLHGEARVLEAGSPPVGVLENTYALDEMLALNPGDCLVIATDGLSEAHNVAGEQFGDGRLIDLVHQYGPEATAEELARYLFNEIDTFAEGAGQSDDQTIFVLKVN